MLFKFNKNDILDNIIELYPSKEIIISQSGTFIDRRSDDTAYIPTSSIVYYPINHNNQGSNTIYPFIIKNAQNDGLYTYSSAAYNSATFGTIISGTYLNYKTYSRYRTYDSNHTGNLGALKNIIQSYKYLDPYIDVSNILTASQNPNASVLLTFPREFYGSKINPGSVHLDFYINQKLLTSCSDIYKNGVLFSGTTKVGFVLYNHGCILINHTGSLGGIESWDTFDFQNQPAKWIFFGDTGSHYSDYRIKFEGTTRMPHKTLFCHAPAGYLNNSTNMTFLSHSQEVFATGSFNDSYTEKTNLLIKNIASSSWETALNNKFKKITYISQIHLYDKEQNLIGIAKVANPIRKKEHDKFTIKLDLDL
jgi:hypothetical protein